MIPETLHCFDNNAKNICGAMKSYIKKSFLLTVSKTTLNREKPILTDFFDQKSILKYSNLSSKPAITIQLIIKLPPPEAIGNCIEINKGALRLCGQILQVWLPDTRYTKYHPAQTRRKTQTEQTLRD
ncbi:hypothetical protein TH25_22055 [Thalassospira profundimaris]|uniref:Uncharacterized protein n=1 Tax=Thalassospira profundimaris TaxID=502049 RepID=A0A367WP01_9PROT|nr:hypothetical protein [Thalassospira profundimaris]RCK43127.1 hypothetical protein TH25_22055 [Thalassospira profundimaris]